MNAKSINITLAAAIMSAVFVLTGCIDIPPSLPRNAEGLKVATLAVTSDGEKLNVRRMVDAKLTYFQSLTTLNQYYHTKGVMLKAIWSDREIENLQDSFAFEFTNIGENKIMPGPSISKSDEASLVELVVSSREAFVESVNELILYYTGLGDSYRAGMVDNIRQRFDPVRTYMYFADAEVPPADLKPDQVIADAEALYTQALDLHESGWLWFTSINKGKQRQALLKFLELVRKYPASRRIAPSAYYIGLIYSKVFDENYRSILWYTRCLQWDKELSLPVRFNAAVLADKELRNPSLAIEYYTQVVERGTANTRDIEYAKKRIIELSK